MTMLLYLLLLSLLTYRLARMVTQEDGPFDCFTRLRQWVGQVSWVGRGFHCVACTSFYLAGMAALYLALFGVISWRDFPLVWFGTAGGSLAMYQVVR